jgi:hypothetical protein
MPQLDTFVVNSGCHAIPDADFYRFPNGVSEWKATLPMLAAKALEQEGTCVSVFAEFVDKESAQDTDSDPNWSFPYDKIPKLVKQIRRFAPFFDRKEINHTTKRQHASFMTLLNHTFDKLSAYIYKVIDSPRSSFPLSLSVFSSSFSFLYSFSSSFYYPLFSSVCCCTGSDWH